MEQKNRNDTALMYNWTNRLQRIAQQADQAQLPKNTSPAISQNSPHECELDKYFLQISSSWIHGVLEMGVVG